MKRPVRRRNAAGALLTSALLGAAIQKELSRPPEERTWEGKVGPVPYDLRPPTVGRMRRSWWDPEGGLVTPQPFGLGWTLNLGRFVRLAKSRRKSG